jgi:hypothetical protein
MKDMIIKKIWEDFINNYKSLFKDNNEIWYENLNKLKNYLNKHGKLPVQHSKNKEENSLANWLSQQKQNYKNLFP